MSTVAVVTSQIADEEWVFRVVDGALVVVDAAPYADVIVASEDCLAAIIDHLPATAVIVVIGDPLNPPERAAHIVTRTWPDAQLRALLVALAGSPQPAPALTAPTSPAEAQAAQRAITAARRLAAVTELAACESTIVEILVELVELDRAYCLFYDAATASLWSEAKLQSTAGDDRRAAAGIAGWAAVTGLPTTAAGVGDDPRFVGAIDDPSGDPTDRLIAQPVHGSDGAVHAVLIGARRARRPPIGDTELGLMARFARLVTPVLDQLSIHVAAQQILDDAAGDQGLFRKEARDAQAMPRWGDVVRVSPGWLSWAYWLLVVLLAGSVVFISIGEVSTYSAGPAVVRSTARTPISARTAGNIAAVLVAPGDSAATGAIIARLDDSDQRAAATRLEHEFETRLRNHMLDPADTAVDGALRGVRNELETARASLEERLVRATAPGIIGDVRVRPGQRVEPGDIVASVFEASQGLEVIALLPGEDRPQLAPGMTIRLELAGYRYAYQAVVISSVSTDVIAPAEAKRVLGAEVAEGLHLPGSVMVVRGRLASQEFTVDGQTFRYHDGMVGLAEVRVRSEPIVFALIPGTRRFSQ
ncbi:MAG: HlyD family efflux transporter periplasmic adaptor subunit [Kofleriaceae bacterium]